MLRFHWISDYWEFFGHYFDIQENFNPEMGFVKRTGIRHFQLHSAFSPEPDIPFVRRLYPHVRFDYLTVGRAAVVGGNVQPHEAVFRKQAQIVEELGPAFTGIDLFGQRFQGVIIHLRILLSAKNRMTEPNVSGRRSI